ncbi:DUF4309 domain-containing protein [Jeotgalibacillus sp. R-1-5s-1]|uniref:DUF4309 domain-containing protein n=1 Tax=Jeotgalibacillus sp. R-1-5s-1 TaxID=2555897 RepID=UPI0010699FBF|nr:DUF4309 domain-containing protein [Jeotgalibacillus sp. R-1-5s-1]TFD97090.1 DUF4309 domain-containing protein [Jeotgalibacillus sp. R-1-5s-1]
MKKLISIVTAVLLFLSISSTTEASGDSRLFVKWDDSTLVEGQIGRVALVKNAVLFKMENGSLKKTNLLRTAGNKYRVYGFKGSGNYQYLAVGGGYYLHNTTATVYETPSASKFRQLALLVDDSMISSALRSQVEDGTLPRTPITVWKSTVSDMKAQYGTPKYESTSRGAYVFSYEKFSFFATYLNNAPGEDLLGIGYTFHSDYTISPSEIKKRLGSTGLLSDGFSEYTGGYLMVYKMGDYELRFEFKDAEGKKLQRMDIVKK